MAQIASALHQADGHWIMIETLQPLQSTDSIGASDLYRIDLLSDRITLVSVTPGGRAGNAASQDPAADAYRELIAFQSAATNLVLGDDNQVSDIFVRDLALEQTTRVSHGEQASANPALDARGGTLLYDQAHGKGRRQVLGQARAGDATSELLSLQTSDSGTLVDNHHPAISGDGRFIAYLEHSADSNGEPPDCQVQIYQRDTEVYHRQPCPEPVPTASDSFRLSFSSESDILYWHVLPGQPEPVVLTNPLAEMGASGINESP